MAEIIEGRERMTIMRTMYTLMKRREQRKGKEEAYDLILMMIEYGLNGVVPDEDSELYDSFIIVSKIIDSSNKFSDFGKSGGRGNKTSDIKPPLKPIENPLKPSTTPLKPPLLEGEVEVEVEVEGEVEGEGEVKKGLSSGLTAQHTPISSKHFKKPSVDDVRAYCDEKGFDVDADRFVDFYESKGWKVGRDTMKDWKAALRNWARNDSGTQTQTTGQQVSPFDPSKRRLMELRPVDAD